MIDKYKKIDCNGCKACKNICPQHAIRYKVDDEGFWYPEVDYELCVSCGVCVLRCPNKTEMNIKQHHPQVKAAWSNDAQVRMDSTSGGLFYELARKILLDAGYVVGCVYDDDYKGAHHTIIHKLEELAPLMVSKYVESDTEDIFSEIEKLLIANKKVLFVGSACQCAGLYSYLNKLYDNLIMVDFLCRGANSPKAHRRYIEYLEQKYDASITGLRSKDKRNGWEQFGQSATFSNGKEYYASRNEDLRVLAYHYGNLMVREACLDCKFKTIPRLSDITLGDFWGIGAEEVEDKDKGVSVVFVNSEKGNQLFDSIKSRISYVDKNLESALPGNPAILYSATASKNRNDFLNNLDKLPFDELVNKYKEVPKHGIRFYLSELKRKVKKLLKEV